MNWDLDELRQRAREDGLYYFALVAPDGLAAVAPVSPELWRDRNVRGFVEQVLRETEDDARASVPES